MTSSGFPVPNSQSRPLTMVEQMEQALRAAQGGGINGQDDDEEIVDVNAAIAKAMGVQVAEVEGFGEGANSNTGNAEPEDEDDDDTPRVKGTNMEELLSIELDNNISEEPPLVPSVYGNLHQIRQTFKQELIPLAPPPSKRER